jgi:lipoate-protein ligase A
MNWYFMDSGPLSGEENMALDLAMMEVAREGNVLLRMYSWKPPTLSLGKFQKLDDINVEMVRNQGFDMVRRPSGGRAVLHMDEVTYAIALPEEYLSKSVLRSYMEISTALVVGLKKLGLDVYMMRERSKERYTDFAACFATTALHEVMIDGKKLIGSAQTRKEGAILQHGSIPIHSHIEEYVNCFELDEREKQLLKKRLSQKTTSISEHTHANNDEVKAAILKGFSEKFDVNFTHFNRELSWEKYVLDVKIWD